MHHWHTVWMKLGPFTNQQQQQQCQRVWGDWVSLSWRYQLQKTIYNECVGDLSVAYAKFIAFSEYGFVFRYQRSKKSIWKHSFYLLAVVFVLSLCEILKLEMIFVWKHCETNAFECAQNQFASFQLKRLPRTQAWQNSFKNFKFCWYSAAFFSADVTDVWAQVCLSIRLQIIKCLKSKQQKQKSINKWQYSFRFRVTFWKQWDKTKTTHGAEISARFEVDFLFVWMRFNLY